MNEQQSDPRTPEEIAAETIDDYYGDDDNEYRCIYCGTYKYEPRYKPSKYAKNIKW